MMRRENRDFHVEKKVLHVYALSMLAYLMIIVTPAFLSGSGTAGPKVAASDFNDNARLLLWSTAIDIIRAHPLLGIGPAQFIQVSNPIASHPHNSLLQIAAEYGFPMATVLLYLIAIMLSNSSRAIRQIQVEDRKTLLIGSRMGLIAGFMHSLVSGVIVTPLAQLSISIALGMTIGLSRDIVSAGQIINPNNASTFLARTAILVAALLSLMGIWQQALPDLADRHGGYSCIPSHRAPGPRIWQITNKLGCRHPTKPMQGNP